MSDRYLLHVPTNTVYIWQHVFSQHEDFIECADHLGTPISAPVSDDDVTKPPALAPAKKVRRKTVVEEPDFDDTALQADASRGLSK